MLAPDDRALCVEQTAQHSASGERQFEMKLIHLPHQCQIGRDTGLGR